MTRAAAPKRRRARSAPRRGVGGSQRLPQLQQMREPDGRHPCPQYRVRPGESLQPAAGTGGPGRWRRGRVPGRGPERPGSGRRGPRAVHAAGSTLAFQTTRSSRPPVWLATDRSRASISPATGLDCGQPRGVHPTKSCAANRDQGPPRPCDAAQGRPTRETPGAGGESESGEKRPADGSPPVVDRLVELEDGAGAADQAKRKRLTGRALTRRVVLAMIKRRAAVADLPPSTCRHTFRATGITAYLSNGGTRSRSAGHASPKTTKIYDRTADRATIDESEHIVILTRSLGSHKTLITYGERKGNQMRLTLTLAILFACVSSIQAQSALVLDFGVPVAMAVGQVHEATAAGIVSATLDYGRMNTSRAARGAICGYVGPNRQSLLPESRSALAVMLGAASMQCRNGEGCAPPGVYLPIAAMSMPVGRGQFWTVVSCSGGSAVEQGARAYFQALTLGAPGE